MKIKRIPEDFQVEELPTVEPGDAGAYTFYRLTKRGLGTLEALEAIRRRWNLGGAQVSHGGLKDRHAETVQYLTIQGGPSRPLRQTNLELAPLGRLAHPYGPAHFRGNRFRVVLRDLSPEAAGRAARAVAETARDGLPNYFDDQRFGSVGFDGGFIAEAWIKGEHERALRLALAEPNPHDRPGTRDEKAILRETWGRWDEAKARLPRSHARSLVTYLADHPDDFRGAFARLNRTLRTLYFSAYQSYLWNLLLARFIENHTRPDQRAAFDFRVARLPIPRNLDAQQFAVLSETRLPLPAARQAAPTGEIGAIATAVLAERDLAWEDLRVRHLKDVFFSKGTRPALFFAEDLTQQTAPDELYPGRQKMVLGFTLGRGSYATMLVKRVTEAA
jgi:tRNA pseudouridine13 synthase